MFGSSSTPSEVSSGSPSTDPELNHSAANESASEEMAVAPSDGSASEKTSDIRGSSQELPAEILPDPKESDEKDPAGKAPTGKGPDGEDPDEEEPTGKESTGEEPAGKESIGEDPTGKDPAGEKSTGEEPAAADPEKAVSDEEALPDTVSGEAVSDTTAPGEKILDMTAADIISAAQETVAKAIETFSITLRNLVYGTPESADPTASFVLKISKRLISDDLLSSLTGWVPDSSNLNYEYAASLNANSGPIVVRGIPSICPVKIYTEVNDQNDDFSKSFIVDGKHRGYSQSSVKVNTGMNQTGDHEYSLIQVKNLGTLNPLFIINDSDIALKLSLDVDGDGSPFAFFIDGSASDLANPEPGNPAEITLPAKAYGIFSAGGAVSDSTGVRITPIGATVNQSISPDETGSYSETDGFWSLQSGTALKDGAYVMFRAEEPKTDNEQEEEKTPSEPETPSSESEPEPETQPQTETPPANPTPEGPASSPAPKKKKDTKAPSNPDENRTYRNTTSAPSDANSSGQTTAVDTADRTPVELYVVIMIAAATAVMVLRRIRSKRQSRQ